VMSGRLHRIRTVPAKLLEPAAYFGYKASSTTFVLVLSASGMKLVPQRSSEKKHGCS
jgi:hypothetical protein